MLRDGCVNWWRAGSEFKLVRTGSRWLLGAEREQRSFPCVWVADKRPSERRKRSKRIRETQFRERMKSVSWCERRVERRAMRSPQRGTVPPRRPAEQMDVTGISNPIRTRTVLGADIIQYRRRSFDWLNSCWRNVYCTRTKLPSWVPFKCFQCKFWFLFTSSNQTAAPLPQFVLRGTIRYMYSYNIYI